MSHISSFVLKGSNTKMDSLIVNLNFQNGICSLSYFSNGNKNVAKERIEVFDQGNIAIINDFKNMNVNGKKSFNISYTKPKKGHSEELQRFLRSIKNGEESPISFKELVQVSEVSFKIIQSIQNLETIKLL